MKKIFFCSLLLLSISFAYAQDSEITIAGKAVDDTGESFPGVSVYKKGVTLPCSMASETFLTASCAP